MNKKNSSKLFLMLVTISMLISIMPLITNIAEASGTLYERHTVSSDNSYTLYGALRFKAQTFTIGNTGDNDQHLITSVKLNLSKQGTVAGNFNVSIRATSGGYPTGSDLLFGYIACSTITGPGWYEINFPSPYITLEPSTMYAIVVRATQCTSSSNCIIWLSQNVGAYTGGAYRTSTDGGVTWSTGGVTDDMLFQEYGTAITAAVPTITLISPANSSTGQSLTPTCSIWANQSAGDSLTVTWQTNHTGSWVTRQVNNTVTANTTVRYIYAGATKDLTKYWWKVYAYDGTTNISKWFSFTTQDNITLKWTISSTGIYPDCPPVSKDINGDGVQEIFILGKNSTGTGGRLLCINGNTGATIWFINFAPGLYIDQYQPVVLADLLNDGRYQIIHGIAYETVKNTTCRWATNGTIMWFNSAVGPGSHQFLVADIDGNSRPYVFILDTNAAGAAVGYVYKLFGNNGTVKSTSSTWLYHCSYGGLSAADLNNDGRIEIVATDQSGATAKGVHCFNENLTLLWNSSVSSSSHSAMIAIFTIFGISI